MNDVFRLSCIFYEKGVTFGVKDKVVEQAKIVGSMNSEGTIEALVDCQPSSVRSMNSPDHVEMNSVPTHFESLTDICHFNVRQPTDRGIIS